MPVSRVTTWNALDLLTASALNGEFNQVMNNCVSLTGAENLTNKTITSPLLTGAGAGRATLQNANTANNRTWTFPDIGGSSQPVATLLTPTKWENTVGLIHNMRLSYASGLFKVVGLDGNDLSATNPGFVSAQNNSGTGVNFLTFTSSPSFQDDAHASDSDFVGTGTMSWGTTAAVAWGDAMPFLLGVCTDGTTPIMVIARGPVADTGASSNIGYWDNAPSSASQNNVFALTSTNVTTTHADQKITWIGSFRMTKSSADDWTVSALDKNDGINDFYNFGKNRFNMPTGQNGATSGKHFANNGGTAPTYTDSAANYFKYSINMDGEVSGRAYFENDTGGTAGAGSVDLTLVMPLAAFNEGATVGKPYIGFGDVNEAAGTQVRVLLDLSSNGTGVRFLSTASFSTVLNTDQSSTSRFVNCNFKYKAF